jgi:hypothetical protein
MHELDELLKHSGANDLTLDEAQIQDDILKHYGVKGMKWKDRKEPEDNESDSGGKEVDEGVFDELGDDATDLMKKMGSKAKKVRDRLKKGIKKGIKSFKSEIKSRVDRQKRLAYRRKELSAKIKKDLEYLNRSPRQQRELRRRTDERVKVQTRKGLDRS